jgi:hypothetical protein
MKTFKKKISMTLFAVILVLGGCSSSGIEERIPMLLVFAFGQSQTITFCECHWLVTLLLGLAVQLIYSIVKYIIMSMSQRKK